jgi:PRTRC genetic system protein A
MIEPFVDYKVATDPTLPPIASRMKEYCLAGNGVFVRAERQGLSASIPVANCTIPGLPSLTSYVLLKYPLVPANIVGAILRASQAVGKKEILFYLWYANGNWQLNIPEQLATPLSVKPLVASLGSAHETALIEIHSHHSMNAIFSSVDDLEESGKFRLFAVLGEIFTRPIINVRVGIYSHFWQIPANWVFQMPIDLTDFSELCS